jgi:hypothetical protein
LTIQELLNQVATEWCIMVAMTYDLGEALFARYLQANGYEILAYEPDLGTSKRPDFLIRSAEQEVVVEVESFNTPSMPITPRNGFVNMAPKLRAVRNKISAGAAQLKGIEGYPLVVVLANPRNSWVPLEGPMFVGALFGDPQASFSPDGGAFFHSGRNGRLHVKEPDGSVHGNHPYLSAVAVLRFIYPHDAWAEAMQQSQAEIISPLGIVREAHQLLAQQGEAVAEAVCLDVFESVSESAAPLPCDVFAGPHDTRWGITGPGGYRQIAGPPG